MEIHMLEKVVAFVFKTGSWMYYLKTIAVYDDLSNFSR